VHVHGSAGLDAAVQARRAVAGAGMQNIILGRANGANGPRWLSKAEISDGVIAALETPYEPRSVVGQQAA